MLEWTATMHRLLPMPGIQPPELLEEGRHAWSYGARCLVIWALLSFWWRHWRARSFAAARFILFPGGAGTKGYLLVHPVPLRVRLGLVLPCERGAKGYAFPEVVLVIVGW